MTNDLENYPPDVRPLVKQSRAAVFPFTSGTFESRGITKRELFAAMAMQGFLASLNGESAYKDVAADAVGYADALLAALRETP